MTQKTVVTILRANLDYLHARYGVKRIGFFGSFAAGTVKKTSDVDLVVEFDRPIGFEFIELSAYLEKALGRRVDLLTQDGLKTIRSRAVMNSIRGNIKYV